MVDFTEKYEFKRRLCFFISSHPHIFVHLQVFIASKRDKYWRYFASSYLHILTSSQPYSFESVHFKCSDFHIFISSHLHILTSLHIDPLHFASVNPSPQRSRANGRLLLLDLRRNLQIPVCSLFCVFRAKENNKSLKTCIFLVYLNVFEETCEFHLETTLQTFCLLPFFCPDGCCGGACQKGLLSLFPSAEIIGVWNDVALCYCSWINA